MSAVAWEPRAYSPGAIVSFEGREWIAVAVTNARPGDTTDWQTSADWVASIEGPPGASGESGPAGEPGPRGRAPVLEPHEIRFEGPERERLYARGAVVLRDGSSYVATVGVTIRVDDDDGEDETWAIERARRLTVWGNQALRMLPDAASLLFPIERIRIASVFLDSARGDEQVPMIHYFIGPEHSFWIQTDRPTIVYHGFVAPHPELPDGVLTVEAFDDRELLPPEFFARAWTPPPPEALPIEGERVSA